MKYLVLFISFCSIFSIDVLSQGLTAVKSPEGIEILEKGNRVLFYQVKPKSQNGKYERAGYVHPLYSLKGNILTEDFPEDHPYHHGIFWAWHQIILNGKQIADGWTSDSISWTVKKTTVRRGKQNISINAEVIWWSQAASKVRSAIVKENTIIVVHSLMNGKRIIDFDIHLAALVDSLKIGGSDDPKGYGGFCLRLKLPEDIQFVSNDTLVAPQETAVTAGRQMNFRGSFDGASSSKSSVSLTANPDKDLQNYSWILRNKGSMQNAVFPGREPVVLTKKGIRLKYSLSLGQD